MKTSVSCIIPAYNEETTIAHVVRAALDTTQIHEVIVVNDGSTDQTIQAIIKLQYDTLKFVSLNKNIRKVTAVSQALKHAHNDIILLLAADLVGLKPHHI